MSIDGVRSSYILHEVRKYVSLARSLNEGPALFAGSVQSQVGGVSAFKSSCENPNIHEPSLSSPVYLLRQSKRLSASVTGLAALSAVASITTAALKGAAAMPATAM